MRRNQLFLKNRYLFGQLNQYFVKGFPLTWNEVKIKQSLNLKDDFAQIFMIKQNKDGQQMNSGKFIIKTTNNLNELIKMNGTKHFLSNNQVEVQQIDDDINEMVNEKEQNLIIKSDKVDDLAERMQVYQKIVMAQQAKKNSQQHSEILMNYI